MRPTMIPKNAKHRRSKKCYSLHWPRRSDDQTLDEMPYRVVPWSYPGCTRVSSDQLMSPLSPFFEFLTTCDRFVRTPCGIPVWYPGSTRVVPGWYPGCTQVYGGVFFYDVSSEITIFWGVPERYPCGTRMVPGWYPGCTWCVFRVSPSCSDSSNPISVLISAACAQSVPTPRRYPGRTRVAPVGLPPENKFPDHRSLSETCSNIQWQREMRYGESSDEIGRD